MKNLILNILILVCISLSASAQTTMTKEEKMRIVKEYDELQSNRVSSFEGRYRAIINSDTLIVELTTANQTIYGREISYLKSNYSWSGISSLTFDDDLKDNMRSLDFQKNNEDQSRFRFHFFDPVTKQYGRFYITEIVPGQTYEWTVFPINTIFGSQRELEDYQKSWTVFPRKAMLEKVE